MIDKYKYSLINSNLKHSINYFIERIDTFHVNSHFREYYLNAILDLLLVDELATLTYIRQLDNEKQLLYIMGALSGYLIAKFPTKRLLKVCKEQIDKYPDSDYTANYVFDYQRASEFLESHKKQKKEEKEYRAKLRRGEIDECGVEIPTRIA